jgi:hypothetical protein
MPARKLSDRHPFEIFMLSTAMVSSFPAAAGFAPPPNSIAQQLPGWPSRAWAIILMLGCAIALVGLAKRRPPWPVVSVTALGFEQVGLTIAGGSTTIYALAVIASAGVPALVPAGLSLAFGLACFAQAWKIERILRDRPPLGSAINRLIWSAR